MSGTGELLAGEAGFAEPTNGEPDLFLVGVFPGEDVPLLRCTMSGAGSLGERCLAPAADFSEVALSFPPGLVKGALFIPPDCVAEVG